LNSKRNNPRDTLDKVSIYKNILRTAREVLQGARLDRIGAMSTLVAVLMEQCDYFDWCGFYRVVQPGQLEIGPYQGHLACLQIPFTRGVCGACATQRRTIIVPDVRLFAGYIACDSKTLSEIVVPVVDAGEVTAVLDIDSDDLDTFDAVDQTNLEDLMQILTESSR
jgi:GAF domain-containing protein